MLYLGQIKLLGSQDGARSSDSDPADESLGTDLVVLHRVDADKSACAAKTSFAMNRDGASFGVGEVGLTGCHELVHDSLGRGRAISKHHIFVVDVFVDKALSIVLGLVKTNYLGDVQVLENVDVACSCVAVSVDRVTLVNGSHEGQEFAWDNPVEVAVLDLLVVLVLTGIECLEVVPSKSDTHLESLKAMHDSAVVVAVTPAGISEVTQVRCVRFELSECLTSIHLQNHDHESAHQVG